MMLDPVTHHPASQTNGAAGIRGKTKKAAARAAFALSILTAIASSATSGCSRTIIGVTPSAATSRAMGSGRGVTTDALRAFAGTEGIGVISVAHVASEPSSSGDTLWRIVPSGLVFCSGGLASCQHVDTGSVPADLLAPPSEDVKWARADRRRSLASALPSGPYPFNAVWVRRAPSTVFARGEPTLAYCVAEPRIACFDAKIPIDGMLVKEILAVNRLHLPEPTDTIWLQLGTTLGHALMAKWTDSPAYVRCVASQSKPMPMCTVVNFDGKGT